MQHERMNIGAVRLCQDLARLVAVQDADVVKPSSVVTGKVALKTRPDLSPARDFSVRAVYTGTMHSI